MSTNEREWESPDLRDMHSDLIRLRSYELGGERWKELMRAAADMLVAADVELQEPK